MSNRYRDSFGDRKRLFPVNHVRNLEQALRNIETVVAADADGIFLIGHGMPYQKLVEIYQGVRSRYPEFWIGLNCLDLPAYEAIEVVAGGLSQQPNGLWSDDIGVRERPRDSNGYAERCQQRMATLGFTGCYFGGTAFKYQVAVASKDLPQVAKLATQYADVVTTSGVGTGHMPEISKIMTMREAIGRHPLAIASGIAIENVKLFLPYTDAFLVASSLETQPKSDELDLERVKALAAVIHGD
jgi:hypothetical protein